MNLPILLAVAPFVSVGGPLTNWLISLLLIGVIIAFVVWAVTKFAGPIPAMPAPWSWIIWLIVGIALLLFLFSALGLRLP